MTAPTPPSADPRWQAPQIDPWRTDAARTLENLTVDTVDELEEYLIGCLRTDGVTVITEELLYVLWTTLPKIAAVIQARIDTTCANLTGCGQAAVMHSSDGLDVFAAGLLKLERRIGELL